ncbi:MAG: response regulator, partial [Deltaproteobacteria bacterium]|nr:response regulator [Deltaproteobacteria bacterium]
RRIADHTAAYGEIFRKIVSAYERKGITPDSGLRGKFRAAAHKLFNQGTMEHAVGDLLAGINDLWVRQRQLNRHDAGSVKKFNQELARFKALLAAHKFYSRIGNNLLDTFGDYQRAVRLYLGGGKEGTTAMARDLDRITAILAPLFVPEVHTLVLQIRQHEKDYLIRGGKQYVDFTHQAITNLLNAFRESGVAEEHIADIRAVLKIYKDNFDALVAEDGKITRLDEQLTGEYTAVQRAMAELSEQSSRQIAAAQRRSANLTSSLSLLSIAICLVAVIIGIFLSLVITNSITRPLKAFMDSVMRMRDGDYAVRVTCDSNDEIGRLGGMFNEMAAIIERNVWQANGRNLLAGELRGDKELKGICRGVLVVLARYVHAQVGTLYTRRSDGKLTLTAAYLFSKPENLPAAIEPGSGLVGEAAQTREVIIINEVPRDYIRVESSLGHAPPKCIIAIPLLWQNKVLGVMELAFLRELSATRLKFLRDAAESIAIAIHSSRQRDKTQILLEESQRQSEELQAQQEELQAANEEMETKNRILEQNEERLNVQQEELQAANEELEEKSEAIRRQKEAVQKKNEALETARRETEQKARELAASSQYKSEFLANMSHELRSPLNSLLLLARNLGHNRDNNLSDGQLKSINIIQNSGEDLLNLINDILDLSKIEAGHMDIAADTVGLRGFGDWLTSNFQHIAADKGIDFKVEIEPDIPMTIVSDRQHLEQIIRNLLTNAIKFTMEGGVTVRFSSSRDGRSSTPAVAIMVIDSGIGIPAAKQELIFDAFKQVDGSTSRKYGGTGLGLSIVRQLTALLGGEVRVSSVPGKGSEFTILLPVNMPEPPVDPADVIPPVVADAEIDVPPPVLAPKSDVPPAAMDDDRDKLAVDDKVLLIIEDDRNFAAILVQQGREQGFKCLAAVGGAEGLRLAEHYKPGAVILDIRLPDINGWQVLESLKANPSLRHIPVHMMSAEERSVDAMQKGAIGFLAKPVSDEDLQAAFVRLENALLGRVRNLLVIEDDPVGREHIADLIGGRDIRLTMTDNGGEALRLLAGQKFDCMILDIGLPDMSGFELLGQLKEQGREIPPVIIHTGRTLTRAEEEELRQYTGTVIVKGVKSEERLLDETALFLHRLMSDLPAEKRLMIASLYDQDTMFKDKRILVVDDDMRNAFALSQILEERGMRIIIADDGAKALEILAQDKKIDLILMDIMMPGMDGYEAMRRIRRDEDLAGIPIITLTAKAMAEDKTRCMEAGASDYLAKPVEEGRLLSMMRVWLYR